MVYRWARADRPQRVWPLRRGFVIDLQKAWYSDSEAVIDASIRESQDWIIFYSSLTAEGPGVTGPASWWYAELKAPPWQTSLINSAEILRVRPGLVRTRESESLAVHPGPARGTRIAAHDYFVQVV